MCRLFIENLDLNSTGGTLDIWIPNCDCQHLLELEPAVVQNLESGLTGGDALMRYFMMIF